MISRLTLAAALFAVVTTGSVAVASTARHAAPPAATAIVKVVQLERVVITGKRIAPEL